MSKETKRHNISVLIPTRGRTGSMRISVISLVNKALVKDKIELIFVFDDDDYLGYGYFIENVKPFLKEKDIAFKTLIVPRMGYVGLNKYYNYAGQLANSDWFLQWSDDAVMETMHWDQKITEHTGEFKILKVHTHNEHPYSIFPIVPEEYYKLLGYFSCHQMGDAEISQNAYALDIIEVIDIHVSHDRADLSGKNMDATYKERVLLENRPGDPRDFHYPTYQKQRWEDVEKIAMYMRSRNIDTSWYDNAKQGKHNIFQKMQEADINGFMNFSVKINKDKKDATTTNVKPTQDTPKMLTINTNQVANK